MTEEQKAALDRMRLHRAAVKGDTEENSPYWGQHPMYRQIDTSIICDIALADHPADGDEPLTTDHVRRIVGEDAFMGMIDGALMIDIDPEDNESGLITVPVREDCTVGEFLRALPALGIGRAGE